MIAGVGDPAMDIGVATGLGLVRAGTAVRIVQVPDTGTVIAVIDIIVMDIVAITMDGGIRWQPLAPEQLSAELSQLPHLRSIVRLPTVIAMPTCNGAIIAIGPTGLRTTLFSRITVLASSVIRHIDSSTS